jgi:hypothetical protein
LPSRLRIAFNGRKKAYLGFPFSLACSIKKNPVLFFNRKLVFFGV